MEISSECHKIQYFNQSLVSIDSRNIVLFFVAAVPQVLRGSNFLWIQIMLAYNTLPILLKAFPCDYGMLKLFSDF